MTDGNQEPLSELRSQNERLNEQVRLLVRTEQRLHRYQAEIDRQLERIRVLNEFGLDAARIGSTREILVMAANALLELIPGDSVRAYRSTANDAGTELVLVGGVGCPESDGEGTSNVVPASELPKAFILIHDEDEATEHPALRAALCPCGGEEAAGPGLWVVLPIAAPAGDALAFLALRKNDHRALGHQRLPTRNDEPFLTLFAAHVEAAISNAELRRSLEHAVADRTRELEGANRDLRVLHIAIEGVADAIEVCNNDKRFQYVNPAFERLTGYKREEVLGKTPAELFQAATAIPDEVGHALAAGRSWVGRLHGKQKDGSAFEHDITMSPVVDDETGTTKFVAVRRDVTASRQLEHQLRLSEHMASVGRLAAGMAHEINNPLAYVSLNLNYLRDALLETPVASEISEEVDAALEEAVRGADRMASIVRDLTSFSRVDQSEGGVADLGPVVESAARMAGNEIRHKARLVLDLGDTPPVSANASRLGQVVLNLLINAAQAIDEGAADKNEIRVTTRTAADGSAVIEVRDSGPGMSPDVARRAFDPFFTTKAIGEGTGLGLSICHAITTGIGGTIRVESELGAGARFIVSMPSASGQLGGGRTADRASAGATQRGRILVIDDEYAVAKAIKRLLRHHHVTVVTSGREGLAHCMENEFDLVLCDLMMPAMTGPDFFQHLAQRSPGAEKKVVFITGGAFTPKAQAFLDGLTTPWFRKPFDVAAFETFVNEFVSTARHSERAKTPTY